MDSKAVSKAQVSDIFESQKERTDEKAGAKSICLRVSRVAFRIVAQTQNYEAMQLEISGEYRGTTKVSSQQQSSERAERFRSAGSDGRDGVKHLKAGGSSRTPLIWQCFYNLCLLGRAASVHLKIVDLRFRVRESNLLEDILAALYLACSRIYLRKSVEDYALR